MHRVYSRCTRTEDISHHNQFIKTVLKSRSQDMADISRKVANFHVKRKSKNILITRPRPKSKMITSVTFDTVSKMHLVTKVCVENSYKLIGLPVPHIVYRSLPKLGSHVSTKRSVLGKVKSFIDRKQLS